MMLRTTSCCVSTRSIQFNAFNSISRKRSICWYSCRCTCSCLSVWWFDRSTRACSIYNVGQSQVRLAKGRRNFRTMTVRERQHFGEMFMLLPEHVPFRGLAQVSHGNFVAPDLAFRVSPGIQLRMPRKLRRMVPCCISEAGCWISVCMNCSVGLPWVRLFA